MTLAPLPGGRACSHATTHEGDRVDRSPSRPSRAVRATALINMAVSLVGAGTGILLARWLGPTGRGAYAAATAYFGVSLIIFELGLTSSVVYFVSRQRARTGDFVRTAITLLVPLAVAASLVSVVLAVTEMHTIDTRRAFLIVPACIVIAFIGAPASFALQASDLRSWNLVRLVQPLAFLPLIVITFVLTSAHVAVVIAVLALSILVQTVLGWVFYSRLRNPPGHFSRQTARTMLRFGLPNLSSTAPNTINGRFDQLVLAVAVPAAALGQYAVAVTLSLLAGPLALAFGNVAFPRLAGGGERASTIRHAVRGSMLVALVGELAVVAVSPFVVPRLFGHGYGHVTILLFILAPGAILFTVNQVLGDVLRGLGRPGLVARCEWVGVVGTLAGLAITIPLLGTAGAALTSSAVYACVHGLLRHSLRRAMRPYSGRHANRHTHRRPQTAE